MTEAHGWLSQLHSFFPKAQVLELWLWGKAKDEEKQTSLF
jgi:hypothetical protein